MGFYKAGSYTLTRKRISIRYVAVRQRPSKVDLPTLRMSNRFMLFRTRSRLSQVAPGKFEIPNWIRPVERKVRDALAPFLASASTDWKRMYAALQMKSIRFVI